MKSRQDETPRIPTIRHWWRALQPEVVPAEGREPPKGPFAGLTRGDRAMLRRCATPDEVLMQSAFHGLCHALGEERGGDPVGLAVAAGCVAHVRQDLSDGTSLATVLGTKGASTKPVMSELRFQRMLASLDEGELFRQVARGLALADGKADVSRLFKDLVEWVRQMRQEGIREPRYSIKIRWATDYFEAALK